VGVAAGFLRRTLDPLPGYWLCGVLVLSGCYLDTPPATPDAVSELLVDLLGDESPEVRRTAAEALGKIGGSSRAQLLAVTASDPDARVREAGAIALGRLAIQGDDVRVLLQALRDGEARVRRAAARSLGELEQAPSAGEQLAGLVKDSQTGTRRAAVEALLQVEAPGVFPQVALAVHDVDAEVRQGAVAALGEWWGAKSIPLLRDRLLRDVCPGVRAEAAYRLGKIGNEGVVKDLDRAAATDRDPAVRRWAMWARDQLRRSPGSG
jgi:HEAT repeat protein